MSTRAGYTGGDIANPSYGNHQGHAEAIEIVFDPAVVSYRAVLEHFFQVHDPTTYEQQGSDFGSSYRSAIFYTDEQQKETALATIAEIEASGLRPGPVVTEINPDRARLSRVVTAALLREVAEVVTLPDLRSKAPEDRVRSRDVEEEVGQHQVPDVVVAAEPPAHDRRRQLVCVGLRAGNLVRLDVLQEAARLEEPPLQCRVHHGGVVGCWRVALHQLRHVRVDLVAAYGKLFSESQHVGREPLAKDRPRFNPPGPLEHLGVVEIVVHHVQSVHHDRDRDVIDREGHLELHALVCTLNVGRTRKVDNRNEWSQ